MQKQQRLMPSLMGEPNLYMLIPSLAFHFAPAITPACHTALATLLMRFRQKPRDSNG